MSEQEIATLRMALATLTLPQLVDALALPRDLQAYCRVSHAYGHQGPALCAVLAALPDAYYARPFRVRIAQLKSLRQLAGVFGPFHNAHFAMCDCARQLGARGEHVQGLRIYTGLE